MNNKAYRILQLQNNAILQKSISATLFTKMGQLHDLERNMAEMTESFREWESDELMRDSEYRKQQIDELRKEYKQSESRYLCLFGNLRAIGEQVSIMN